MRRLLGENLEKLKLLNIVIYNVNVCVKKFTHSGATRLTLLSIFCFFFTGDFSNTAEGISNQTFHADGRQAGIENFGSNY